MSITSRVSLQVISMVEKRSPIPKRPISLFAVHQQTDEMGVRKSTFQEKQINPILKDSEAGVPPAKT